MEEKDYNLESLKTKRSYGSLLALLFALFCFQFSGFDGYANNVRIDGKVDVKVEGGLAKVKFTLNWENSWRDAYNWDGVWVFVKYKSLQGDWQHAYLKAGHDHVVTDALGGAGQYDYMPGLKSNGGNSLTGVMLYRSARGFGDAGVKCELLWDVSELLFSQSMFDSHQLSVMVQAVEMVYAPNGAYSLGDAYSNKRFVTQEITSERDTTVADSSGSSVTKHTLAANYPKGYNGFYCMKYELSQEQYVSFLNTLTLVQQQDLLGTDVDQTAVGQYLHGARDAYDQAPHRNGIVMSWKKKPEPYAFDNNLDNNDVFGEETDGQTVACNYLGVKDLLAYCDWAGLRPMTELEYEKTCRRPYPESSERGEFAWNVGGAATPGVISNAFMSTETVASGNANFGAVVNGPLRCGIFAKNNSTQPLSGSSYWGAMEMSGNLHEMCVNVAGGTAYNGTIHGDGKYHSGSGSTWGDLGMANFGLRGGGYDSEASEMRISDRTKVAYFNGKDIRNRESMVGLRAVRTMDVGSITVKPGELVYEGNKTICPEVTLIIKGTEAGVEGISDMYVRYEWYTNGALITGQSAKDLTYSGISNDIATYTFYRKAFCAYGEAQTESMMFTVTRRMERVSPGTLVLMCDTASRFEVKRNSESTMTWTTMINGKKVQLNQTDGQTVSNYRPTPETFGYGEKNYTIWCHSSAAGLCLDSIDFSLRVGKSCTLSADKAMAILANNVTSTVPEGDQIKLTICSKSQDAEFSYSYRQKESDKFKKYVLASSNGVAIFRPDNNIFPDSLPGKKPVWVKVVIPHLSSKNGCVDSMLVNVEVLNCKVTLDKSVASISGTALDTIRVSTVLAGDVKWWYGSESSVVFVNSRSGVYTPSPFAFTGTGNTNNAVFEFNSTNKYCKTTVPMTVDVKWYCGMPLNNANLGYSGVELNGSDVYNTVAITGTDVTNDPSRVIKQCWIQENLNVGNTVQGTDYGTHRTGGIQRICYGNNQANCARYGGLYSWQEAVNGGNMSTNDDPNYKYIPGSKSIVQGICPLGWHMPSDEEFKELERIYGMPNGPQGTDRVNAWAGEGIGTKLKDSRQTDNAEASAGWLKMVGSTPGIAGDPNSKFRGLPGGHRTWSGYSQPGTFWGIGMDGDWWSSTAGSGTTALGRHLRFDMPGIYRATSWEWSGGLSVRCLRN